MISQFICSLVFFVTIIHLPKCEAKPTPALSRFGSPKYPADFKALDYVNPYAPKGGRIRMGIIGNFDSLNKDIAKGTMAEGLLLTFDPLMKKTQDDPHTWYGVIAEKADLAPDFSSITFYLNPKAKFHDGTSLTAEDVEFSIDLLREKGLPRYKKYYMQIEKIDIPSKGVIKISFKRPSEGYDRELPMIIANLRVLSKKNLQDQDFQRTGLKPLMGNGAYKVSKVDPGRCIVYERVKDYWAADLPLNRGQFNFDLIEIQYYKNNHSLFESFKAGNLDFYFESDEKKWRTAYDFKAIKQGKVEKVEIEHTRPVPVRTLIFNMKDPLFKDIRLRKALAYAFDFQIMNRQFFNNSYHQMTSLFSNTLFDSKGRVCDEVLKILNPYKHHLDAGIFEKKGEISPSKGQRQLLMMADDLLKDAGWVVKEGKRIHEETGKPLVINFMVKDQHLEKIVLEYARSLKKLGIVLNPLRVDCVQYEQIVLNRQFQIIVHSWTNSLSPGIEQTYYFSREMADVRGSSNYMGVKNPAIETLAKNVSIAKTEQDLKLNVQALDRAVMGMFYVLSGFYDNKLCFAYWQERLEMPHMNPAVGTNAMEWWWSKP